ncbi:MAG: phosphotransferase [Gammaproteobacteria bacterium]|nr:phosphotransferase [Gammaproteobacteria bacterium]
MAVHTELGADALERLLAEYGFHEVLTAEPATHGIENSNYFVNAASPNGVEALVVTLFESAIPGDGFAFSLVEHLESHGLSVPVPLRTTSGGRMTSYRGREVGVVKRFVGKHPRVASETQCHAIGAFLGQMHEAAESLDPAAEPHPRDLTWLRTTAAEVRTLLDAESSYVLDNAVSMVGALLERSDVQALPTGIVHGDLFRDNALFEGNELVAVIDFHHAARSMLVFDIAIALNDWALDGQCRMRSSSGDALLAGYEEVRSLNFAETVYLDAFRLYAALCFWISRLFQVKQLAKWGDAYLPEWRLDRILATGRAKDPRWFQRLVNILCGDKGLQITHYTE